MKIIRCDKDIISSDNILEFLQKNELTTISDNVQKQMAPYSIDWTADKELQKREQDPSELSREDQIFLETAFDLHHYWKSRTRALVLAHSYETDYSELSSKLQQVSRAADDIRASENFKAVLDLILSLGNYMNDATKQATGFKLGTLQRLSNTKDERGQRSFLDFVERTVRLKFPELESFMEELQVAITVQKVDVDNLTKEAKAFIQGIENVQTSLDRGNLSDSRTFHPQDGILDVIRPILPDARRKAGFLKDHLENMLTTYERLLKFFGEDSQDESARQGFFKKVAQFLTDYKAAHQKNLDIEEDERRMEKRRQLLNPEKKSAMEKASPAASGAMDHLLERLRAAGPTARDRKERRKQRGMRQARAGINPGDRSFSSSSAMDDLLSPGSPPSGSDSMSLSPIPDLSSAAELGETATDSAATEGGPTGTDIPRATTPLPGATSSPPDVSSRAAEMLMGLRGDGSSKVGLSSSASTSVKDLRDERRRRRRAGSVSLTSGGSTGKSAAEQIPPVPSLNGQTDGPSDGTVEEKPEEEKKETVVVNGGSPALGSPGGEDLEASERAKRILLGMRGSFSEQGGGEEG